jgi:type VI secretion system protein ImpM
MTRAPAPTRIGYFGKIPTRSDFVKVADDQPVVSMLDEWLAQVMTRLPGDPRWKLYYDDSPPVSFAFVGPGRRHAVAGHLVPSHDQSGRRFPFLMMQTVDVAEPEAFVSRCPLAFGPLWEFLATMAPRVIGSEDPGMHLHGIAEALVGLGEHEAQLDEFLAAFTVSSLSDALELEASRLILGLGLLLQPVMHSRPAALQKSLVLPLPKNGGDAMRCQVAAFWLELVTPFIRRTAFDLVLFITAVAQQPVLVIGFGGAAAETLHGVIDPLAGREQQVQLVDNGWIDEQLGIDIDVRALASYLEQPMLPLRLARELFLKTFIGAAT